ncbi:MFS general substrate transporter [Hypoxylon sp. FL0543]|nr:MFS general substrate transporter [Hypoxylon sp. FL0543]
MSTEKHGIENSAKDPSRLGNDDEITQNETGPLEKVVGKLGRDTSSVRHVGLSDVDDTTVFYNLNKDKVPPLTPEIESKIVRKNFWCLLSQTWWIAFLIHLDKSTLSQASTMGIFEDVNMTKQEYNNLFVMFYVGYLIALWPGAWLSQKIGQKHFITGSLFLWAFLLGMHPLVRTGKELMGLRFILGMAESQIIPSTTVIHQAFFPPKKSPWVQLLWWASGSFANVLLTMVAYKLIIDDGHLIGGISSWKWLHIICVVLTFVVFVPLVIFLPNSPIEAKWLSTEEKVHTINIIRRTHAGISNKAFKWSQVRECFTDFKSWLFIFHMFFNELPNNTSQQLPLIIVGFGFTAAQSALFNIAKPLIGTLFILLSAWLLYSTRLGTGYTCAISYIPCFVGGIIELAAPWENKIALVVGTQISTFKPSYLLGLSWAGTTTTGHTKKLFLLASCVVAASVANMISPEFWQPQYKPRYTLPWAFMTAFWFISPGMCLWIRYYLQKENSRRQSLLEQNGSDEENEVLEAGSENILINDDDLDRTDRENLKFIYPL